MRLGRRRSFVTVWVTATVALIGLGSVVAFSLFEERRRVEANERDRLLALARVMDRNIAHELDSTNRVLAEIRARAQGWNGPAAREADSHALGVLCDAMPGVRTLLVIDAAGVVIASSRPEILGRDVSQREYFLTARGGRDPATLYVSAPFTTMLGAWGIALTRVVVSPSGEFEGIVSATLDREYFETLLESVLYAHDTRSTVIHGDGTLFLMVPHRDRYVGRNLRQPGTFLTRHLESGRVDNVLSGRTLVGDDDRLLAHRTVQAPHLRMDKPLVVTISRDQEAMYAPWRRDVNSRASWFAALATSMVGGLVVYQRRQRKFDRAFAEADQARRDAEERFRGAFFEGRVSMAISTPDGPFLDVNPAFCALLGYSRPELIRLRFDEITHPQDRPSLATLTRHIAEGERPSYSEELRLLRKDGTTVWVIMTTTAVYREDRPQYVVNQIQDFTPQKQAEAALRASEAQHRAIADCFPNGAVFLFDRDLRHVVAGGAAIHGARLSPERIVGRRLSELLPARSVAALEPLYRRALDGHHGRTTLQLRGRTFDVHAAPVHDVDVRNGDAGSEVLYGLMTAVDVTDQRRLEAEVALSSRLAALGTLTAGVAHEINNPLSYNIANQLFVAEELRAARALLEGAPDLSATKTEFLARLDGIQEALADARDGAERVRRIVEELRQFAQPQQRRGSVSLQRVARSARKLCDNEVSRRAILVESYGESPPVLGDELQLVEVVVNLLVNAAQAIPGPALGEVALFVGSDPTGRGFIEVRDSGTGISPEVFPRIFDPFFTTKPVGHGTGLGLSVCHRIVEAHGGRIDVKSSPGTGATFRVVLPPVTSA